ncbi:putative bifunctional diguanylate cyclase/phosphodiesterase [Salinimonas lutimaris]|uniref:putative bifunctional diguanylate cyclase/phosphodiesterase n=1 Tax=Salinimonas lutimaris TaxID=914153 RepID=UPI0010C1149B|nr:bifunctional diguanylate cyclase/phosphodiesterase [Salinimonas lutimaris]
MDKLQPLANPFIKEGGFTRLALDHMPNQIFWKDLNLHYLGCNKAFAEVVGLSCTDDVVGKSDYDFLRDTSMAHRYREDDQRVIDTGIPIIDRIEHYDDAHGGFGVVSTTKVPLMEKDQIVGILGICVDITAQKMAESKIYDSEQRLLSIMSAISHGIQENDCTGTITYANQAYHTMLGFEDGQLIGKKFWDVLATDDDIVLMKARFFALLASHSEPTSLIVKSRHKNGQLIWVKADWTYRRDVDGNLLGFTSLISDITQSKIAQDKLDFLAHHDALTQLPNRTLFNEITDKAIKRARRENTMLAVIFLDLDRFKNVNDSLGHSAGDELLVSVAARLQGVLRDTDMVARLGGDEFVVLLEDIHDLTRVRLICEKISRSLTTPLPVLGQTVMIGASQGISIYPNDGDTVDALLSHADAAMYLAKERGRNNYQFYTQALTDNIRRRLEMENSLHLAIVRGEFELFYQPQINLFSNQISGVEALLRWHHPTRGLLSPVEFIDIANETGLIVDIGRWVLQKACNQLAFWQQSHVAINRVAINIAGMQLERGDLVADIAEALLFSGVPAHMLELEVTESFIMQHSDNPVLWLTQLRNIGVHISIDDFGTGYSSLSYLKQLPVQKLKIDKSFIHDIPHDENDMAITAAIVAMAHRLGLAIIAEGVESQEQIDFLLGCGCVEGQGYLFGKPMQASHIEHLLSEQNTVIDSQL